MVAETPKEGEKVDYESKKRMIIYGPPGFGKTLSLATVDGPLHVIDFDRQLKSLVVRWEKLKRPKSDLHWVTIDDRKLPEVAFADAKEALFHVPRGYQYYALDSYTKFGLITTYHTCGVGDRKYNQSTGTDLMSYVTDYFYQVATEVEKLGAWLICIMHERWQEIDTGEVDPKAADAWRYKKTFIAPEVASSARWMIPANCDFVFHIEKRKVFGKRTAMTSVFRTQGSEFIMAKAVGYEDVLKEVEDADIGAIVKKLKLPPSKATTRKATTLKFKPKFKPMKGQKP